MEQGALLTTAEQACRGIGADFFAHTHHRVAVEHAQQGAVAGAVGQLLHRRATSHVNRIAQAQLAIELNDAWPQAVAAGIHPDQQARITQILDVAVHGRP